MGNYGKNYSMRAYVALVGLGANRIDDAVYINAKWDLKGNILTGEN